ncbi:MFS transporter [Sporomusa acidovorans]|uniref:Inner membrane metabolite transport protein YgcS n=1 Tax=Sporomusa acidovorans (strain ATCC 49682 / DSM 3132 / Mol) TaxID=1123286 RepID=A0ABZ3J662_SPOA4|nr:MFS transporter [Sporomusa acidovorans]OZC23523.1 inner membrane metabolite transport protein YgcS [Sporomusa acidovorans DSM 3132]SDF47390.1 Sugar transporter [Sporomusa acidovorans]
MFFGGLTDRIGRKLMYMLDLTVLAVLSILHIFITTAMELVVLRFIIGIAIGANYPISTSLMAEFSPTKYRHIFLGGLSVQWFVGATVAGLIGYFFIDVPGGWQWMLALAAVPAILVFMLRTMPESPRWLLSRNRVEEARSILKKCYGHEADIDAVDQTVAVSSAGFSKLLEPLYLKRIFFVGGFFFCLVLPLFVIYTFAPLILEMMGLNHGKESMLGNVLINVVFLTGTICATVWADTFGRRPLIIWSFAVMTAGMLVLTLFPSGSVWIILVGFALYTFAAGGPNILPWMYSNELFPTEILLIVRPARLEPICNGRWYCSTGPSLFVIGFSQYPGI